MNRMSSVRAMASPVGLYEHVRSNHWRSLKLFAGFLLAFHVMSAALLTPLLIVIDPAHLPLLGRASYLARYFLPVSAIGAVLFGLRFWWHVSAVHRETGFRYVDGTDEPRLVRLIEPLILAAGVRPPFLGVIESPALNAFAVGVRDDHMVVVITRGLIEGLDDEELEAVLAHELIHIRCRDTRLMAAANAFIGNLQWLHQRGWNGRKLEEGRSITGLALLPMFIPVMLLMTFFSQLAFRIGYFSRAAVGSAREFIADAEAVRLTQNPAALASALRKIDGHDRIADMAESHDAMLISGAISGPNATHPSIAHRIAALIQTTGPAMAYAPLRRDTRPSEQRERKDFRRANDKDLIPEITSASRPSLWQIYRQTRDPELDLFGLSQRARRALLVCVTGAAALWGGSWYMTGQALGFQETRAMANSAWLGAKCQWHGVEGMVGGGAMPAECSEEFAQKEADAARAALAATIASRKRQEQQQATQRDAAFRANRCFPFTLKPWGQRLSSGGEPSTDLGYYRRWAEQPIEGVEVPPVAGATNADGLIDYMDMRLLMADGAAYWFGQQGLDTLHDALSTSRHQRALSAFRIALKKPNFAGYFERTSSHPRDVRLLADMPDASPCDFVKKQGTFIAP